MKNKKVFGSLFCVLTSVFCLQNLTSCSGNSLNDLTSYVANIENASAIGIGNVNASNGNVKQQRNANKKDSKQDNNYLLTATEDENGEVNYEELVFTKLKKGSEEISGEESYIAKREEDINTKINSVQQGVVNIKSKTGFEYRITDTNGNALTNWTIGENGNTKFYNITEIKDNIKIESRSEKGKISFFVNEGFKYTISLNNSVVLENIEDNDSNDENSKQGVITIGNLEGDQTYLVQYHGKGKKEILTQDQMDYRIIRVYVSDGFTFVTFMPKTKDENVLDGMFVTGNSNRNIGGQFYLKEFKLKSFAIDNESGHIYSLDNIDISDTYDGMAVASYDDKTYLLYDLSINEKDELVFSPLVANENVAVYSYFKDKYGRKYIDIGNTFENDVMFDKEKNILFFKDESYCKNSNGEPIKIEKIRDQDSNETYNKLYVLDEEDNKREVNENDNFYINLSFSDKKFKVENGWIKEISGDYNFKTYKIDLTEHYSLLEKLNSIGDENKYRFLNNDTIETLDSNINYFDEGNVLCFKDDDLYCLEDIWDFMKGTTDKKEYKILSNCTVEPVSKIYSRFVQTGINGDKYYDVVRKNENGKVKYEAVESGSYVATAKEITLQPLN